MKSLQFKKVKTENPNKSKTLHYNGNESIKPSKMMRR